MAPASTRTARRDAQLLSVVIALIGGEAGEDQLHRLCSEVLTAASLKRFQPFFRQTQLNKLLSEPCDYVLKLDVHRGY